GECVDCRTDGWRDGGGDRRSSGCVCRLGSRTDLPGDGSGSGSGRFPNETPALVVAWSYVPRTPNPPTAPDRAAIQVSPMPSSLDPYQLFHGPYTPQLLRRGDIHEAHVAFVRVGRQCSQPTPFWWPLATELLGLGPASGPHRDSLVPVFHDDVDHHDHQATARGLGSLPLRRLGR